LRGSDRDRERSRAVGCGDKGNGALSNAIAKWHPWPRELLLLGGDGTFVSRPQVLT
jgi:hypothetical protein